MGKKKDAPAEEDLERVREVVGDQGKQVTGADLVSEYLKSLSSEKGLFYVRKKLPPQLTTTTQGLHQFVGHVAWCEELMDSAESDEVKQELRDITRQDFAAMVRDEADMGILKLEAHRIVADM